MSLVDSICEMRPQQVCESSSLWVAELHESPTSDGVEVDVGIVLYEFLKGVAGEINDVEIVAVAVEEST